VSLCCAFSQAEGTRWWLSPERAGGGDALPVPEDGVSRRKSYMIVVTEHYIHPDKNLSFAVAELTDVAVTDVRKLVLPPGEGVCYGVRRSGRDSHVVEKLCGSFGCPCIDARDECRGCEYLVPWRGAFFWMVTVTVKGGIPTARGASLRRTRDGFDRFQFNVPVEVPPQCVCEEMIRRWHDGTLFSLLDEHVTE
jgi:hypothetical protein